MYKVLVMLAVIFYISPVFSASAADSFVDLMIGVSGTDNYPRVESDARANGFDFSRTRGGGAGYGYRLYEKIWLRMDVMFLRWREHSKGIVEGVMISRNEELKNSPLSLQLRYYPFGRYLYLGGGGSANFLEYTYFDSITGNARTLNESKVKFALVASTGIEMPVFRHIYIGIEGRYNSTAQWMNVDPRFASFMFSIAYHTGKAGRAVR